MENLENLLDFADKLGLRQPRLGDFVITVGLGRYYIVDTEDVLFYLNGRRTLEVDRLPTWALEPGGRMLEEDRDYILDFVDQLLYLFKLRTLEVDPTSGRKLVPGRNLEVVGSLYGLDKGIVVKYLFKLRTLEGEPRPSRTSEGV